MEMFQNSHIEENTARIKFSIMTPVYKVEQFLDGCIQSVLNQNYNNFELILVDDGSPDRSGEICDRYAQEDSRIRVFHKQNEGLLATRRYALARAQGDYYIFLDSDDYLEPNALQVIADAICTNNADCVIYGMNHVVDGIVIAKTAELTDCPIVIKDRRELYKKCFCDNRYNPVCRKAVKATVFSGVDYSKFYHISMAEDLLQSVEILKNSPCTVFLPDSLYNYRANPQSMTHTICYENFKVDFTVRQHVLDFLRGENVFTEQDYEDYRGYCVSLLVSQIETIAGFDASKQKKIELYRAILQAPFYMDFLNLGKYNKKLAGKKRLLFELLRHERFGFIFALCSLRNTVLRRK